MGDEPASRGVDPGPSGRVRWQIRRFAEIDSTNRWLLEQARAGAPTGLVAVADHQTAGRGRRGRVWAAPPGSSLLVSVLLRPALDPSQVHVVTMAAALALVEAVHDVASVDAALKWPNDLVVGDRKLAGLLAEADLSERGEVRAVVVGVGCNVAWGELPSELAETATSCDVEAGAPVDRAHLLDAFLDRFGRRLDALDAVAGEYRARLATLGRQVRVELGTHTLVGRATDVDALGRLVVTPDDGVPVTVAVGDVVHLRAL